MLDAPDSNIAQASLFFSVIVMVGSSVAPAYPNREERTAASGVIGE